MKYQLRKVSTFLKLRVLTVSTWPEKYHSRSNQMGITEYHHLIIFITVKILEQKIAIKNESNGSYQFHNRVKMSKRDSEAQDRRNNHGQSVGRSVTPGSHLPVACECHLYLVLAKNHFS